MSPMRRRVSVVVAAACLLILVGCGNGEDGASMAEWRDHHADRLAALDRELSAADAALDQGERGAILGACNLLNDALGVVRDEATPVPDPVADDSLQAALVDVGFAVESCLAGGRSAAAVDVEAAMALVDGARESLGAALATIAAAGSPPTS